SPLDPRMLSCNDWSHCMTLYRNPCRVPCKVKGIRIQIQHAIGRQLFNACIGIGFFVSVPMLIGAQPPTEPQTQSSRKNPLRSSVDSGAKIPANHLRDGSKPASAWRSELLAVDDKIEGYVATLKLIGSLQSNPIHGVTYSWIAQALEDGTDAAASLAIGEESSDEPPKFNPGSGFASEPIDAESTESSKEPREPADKAPKKRDLKSAEEDMRDYLAQEFEPSQVAQTDRSLQGVDAEKAQKPNLYGESRFGQIESQEAEQNQTKSFFGSPSQQARLDRVQLALDFYMQNPESTAARSPWAVMHALLAFGSDYEMIGPNNNRVNAIGWMCHNGLCKTQRIFTPRGNSFVPNVGGGVQGHQGQFLAILAQCQVPPDYPIQIGDQKFTVEDLVLYEMATCREKSELTFKLIGLSYYLDSDKQWRSNDGKVWSIQKLIQEELAQPVVGSACGGTHRLMGYSFAIKQRVLQGQPIQGQYLRAAKFINEFIDYTWQLQNPDGSFSTNWFEGRGNEPNVERKAQTTGHMLEWLLFTVSDTDVRSRRVEKAIDFLLANIYDNRHLKWPIGPRGHAERALALYHKRLSEILAEPQDESNPAENSNIAGTTSRSADAVVAQPQSPLPQGAGSRTGSPIQGNGMPRTNSAQRIIRPARPRR
ncbi:MAG: hypothetical protein ACOVNQ_02800, partial [Pirellula sp.]